MDAGASGQLDRADRLRGPDALRQQGALGAADHGGGCLRGGPAQGNPAGRPQLQHPCGLRPQHAAGGSVQLGGAPAAASQVPGGVTPGVCSQSAAWHADWAESQRERVKCWLCRLADQQCAPQREPPFLLHSGLESFVSITLLPGYDDGGCSAGPVLACSCN